MIHPSYSELIEAINTNNEDDDEALQQPLFLCPAASKNVPGQLIAEQSRLYLAVGVRNPLL